MVTKQEIRAYFAKFGKQGGKTRAKNMTPEERRDAARKAVQARWAKRETQIETSVQEVRKSAETVLSAGKKRAAKRK